MHVRDTITIRNCTNFPWMHALNFAQAALQKYPKGFPLHDDDEIVEVRRKFFDNEIVTRVEYWESEGLIVTIFYEKEREEGDHPPVLKNPKQRVSGKRETW